MPRRPRYNDDPDIEYVPLSVDEAQWVADNPETLRAKGAGAHFARRAAATAAQVARMRVDFDNELRRRTAATGMSRGAPATMSPEQAARFLSPDQLARLFDRLSQEKLAALESMTQKAQDSAAETQALRTRLSGILAELESDGTVPDHIRQKARALAQQVSAERQQT